MIRKYYDSKHMHVSQCSESQRESSAIRLDPDKSSSLQTSMEQHAPPSAPDLLRRFP